MLQQISSKRLHSLSFTAAMDAFSAKHVRSLDGFVFTGTHMFSYRFA